MRRHWSIIENMAQVRVAFSTRHRHPHHPQADVSRTPNVFRRDRFPETGPASSRIKLCLRAEQGVIAANAVVEALIVKVPILSRVRKFSIGVTRYIECV